MKKNLKKLSLGKETVRMLQAEEARHIGGARLNTEYNYCSTQIQSHCPTTCATEYCSPNNPGTCDCF